MGYKEKIQIKLFSYENGTGDCDISFTEKYLGV